jgi:ATP:ADP antiporter, AAA family
VKKFFSKIVDVKPDELRALWLAFVFNFVVLGGYYVVKPIRDDIGAANGVDKLSWMFTGTMLTMILANALFSAIVARMSRRKFLPIAYRFFIVNLALFYCAIHFLGGAAQFWVGVAFFIWVSVFNVFVVTLFWAFMTDVFNTDQGKRLFGFISVGGTVGGILGGLITGALVKKIGPSNLFIASAVMLEAAAWCVKFFPADFKRDDMSASTEAAAAEKPIGGGIVSGIAHVFRSSYLLAICAFMFLYAITTTFIYFQLADVTAHQFHDRAARTVFFAHLDVWVNFLTVLVQIVLTGRLLKWFGVGPTLAFLPVLSVIGFVAMGISPALGLLAVFQVVRRAGNFAVTRPAREVLFIVLRREDKYKAKSFIDTFVYRLGDQIGAWSYNVLSWIGLGLTGISFVAAPMAAIWFVLSLWLGHRQRVLAERQPGSIRAPGAA